MWATASPSFAARRILLAGDVHGKHKSAPRSKRTSSTRSRPLKCFVQVFYSLYMSAAAAPPVAEPVSVMLRRLTVEPADLWSDPDVTRLRG